MIHFNLTGIIQSAVGLSVELVFSEKCDISANFSKKTELSTHSLPQGFSVALPFFWEKPVLLTSFYRILAGDFDLLIRNVDLKYFE